jgi:probable phosphoglycerate mutase
MDSLPTRLPLIYLSRHAETVYNAAHRAQGAGVSSPLTRRGLAQAEAIGEGLLRDIESNPLLDIWSSPSTRTQQTVAIVCEILAYSYFDVKMDSRLIEIGLGDWEGRYYHDVIETHGPIFDEDGRYFVRQAPGGEWYPQIVDRLTRWLNDLHPTKIAIVISHGITTRVLRGLIVDGDWPRVGEVSIADDAPQGTVFRIENGAETSLLLGEG